MAFYDVYIVGLINTNDENSNRALENIIVCDIGNAQQICNMNDKISHIDLILSHLSQIKLKLNFHLGLELIKPKHEPKQLSKLQKHLKLIYLQ